jgi:hypothetical protein
MRIMRLATVSLSVSAVLFTTACKKAEDPGQGGNPDGNTASDADSNGTPAFAVTSPDVTLQPGQEVTYCYYFHTSNTSEVAINKFVSDLAPGSHHMIFFQNPGGTQPADGTIDTNNCGIAPSGSSGGGFPVWTYSTQTPHNELDLPADDGGGKPLAETIAPNTPAYLQLHYLNSGDTVLTAHAELSAYALAASAQYTATYAFVTYNGNISVGPGASGVVESQTCSPVSTTAKFWLMSTHSHKQSVHTDVMDGSSVVFSSDDWSDPGATKWDSPFYSFASGTLTYECTYDNTTPPNSETTIHSGPSASTDEMCMASGYYFPATSATFCYNNFVL